MMQSIHEAAASLRDGSTTPRDLVDACLRRIDEVESRVRAWVVVDAAGARRDADAAAQALRSGNDRGLLHGIPIGIKDIVDVTGLPTLAGSKVRTQYAARHDAYVVERLRTAGAIILGKTVTTEFASFDPPPTRNPWNAQHTPGGSSSGSAAAVASGMCFAAVGSQTGGSIIRPASYCGACGMKPTWGRLSLRGIVPLAFHLDHPGPIARNVPDLEIAYRAMLGHDAADPFSLRPDEADSTAFSDSEATAPRIGVVADLFHDRANADVREAVAAALDRCRAAGAVVESVELPLSFADVVPAHRTIMAVEAAAYHRETFAARRNEYGPRIASLIDEGLAATSTDYARALKLQRQFRHDMQQLFAADRFDALAMPAVSNTAPLAETTGDPTFQAPWSFAGLPVVSMPCGLGADGLPVAVQYVGPAWREASLLRTAAWCEQATGFAGRPQP